METTALPTLAIRRILGLEKKNRKQVIYYIEDELRGIIGTHHLAPSDFSNLALQEYVHHNGIPVLLMSLQPEGMILQHPNQSDVMNLALSDLLQKKGYLTPHISSHRNIR